MLNKFISYIVILSLLINNLVIANVSALESDDSEPVWTTQMANHLARKALLWIDSETIEELYLAWSAQDAVDILFPSKEWPDRTEFEQKLTDISADEDFDFTSANNMRKYYIAKKYLDPYQAKAKLFLIFEDIFSVFKTSDISYVDIENTHDLLYNYTLWNYKDMIKRNLYNNWSTWDYSIWEFLDLFNQSNPASPNQNYWRELLQLLLMLEYVPTETLSESEDNQRNYTEDDVDAVSKILVWFESDENTHEVTYNTSFNTNEKITFLDWELKTWDSFSFYSETTTTDEDTWETETIQELDIQEMKNSIDWNNWLPDNTIDYIFSKREYAISMFLADKLYRFYVAENPTNAELKTISNKIIENDFEFYPVVKWLLADDIMYSEKSMDAVIYKNPVELSLWTAKILWLDNTDISYSSLYYLGRSPYAPNNIFWRDWFDKNAWFFTAYTQTQWVSQSSIFVPKVDLDSFLWEKIYLTPYISWDLSTINSLFDDDVKTLEITSWTWSWWEWTVNLNNFNIIDSDSNPITITSWNIDFDDLSIYISENEKILITSWELNYEDAKITINSWTYVNNWVSTNISWTTETNWFYIIQKDYDEDSLIWFLEDKLYFWRKLSNEVTDKLKYFLTHDKDGNIIEFDFNDDTYKKYYVRWLINLMLVQPEYILQSWIDSISETDDVVETEDFINNDSKLIIIKAWWGFDFLSWVVPADEYDTYSEYRWEWALSYNETEESELIKLNDDYYLNSALSPFKDLYDDWYLKIINRVWTPDHSRAHDASSKKMTSFDNTYTDTTEWIIWHFISDEDYSKTIVMGSYRPYIFNWGNYLNVWSNAYYNISTSDSTNSDFREYKKDTVKDILKSREYPSDLWNVFINSTLINDVSVNSQANWWRAGAGYNMEDNFTFLESMFDSNVSSIARMSADGWYDTHWNQKSTLVTNLTKVWERTSEFFNNVKDKQDITIVIFSEFWRTNKINSSVWTDHGKAWWMFIISNNENINSNLTEDIYWNLSFKNAESNRLWVGIDYRAVYSNIMNLLYSQDVSDDLWTYNLDDYIDETWPKVEFFRKEYDYRSSSRNNVWVNFKVNDSNFHPKEASYLKIEYWTDIDNLYEVSSWRINKYMDVSDENVSIYLENIAPNTAYFYKITLYDNQYNETILEWSFRWPDIIDEDELDDKVIDSDFRISDYDNTSIDLSNIIKDESSNWILLWSSTLETEITSEDSIKLILPIWTYIEELSSTLTWTMWNWWFVIPKKINTDYFFSDSSVYDENKLSNMYVENLIQVWADTLWVWMNLNQDVIIEVEDIDTSKKYAVLSSEDWIQWEKENDENVKVNSGNLQITTNHFTYFAIVEIDSSWNILVDLSEEETWTQVESTISYNTWSNSSSPLTKDKCEYWDYSESYYDNTCWEDPDAYIAMQSDEMTETYRLEQAVEQLREKEEYKAEVFDETFVDNDNITDKKNVLVLLREKLSYIFLNEHKLVHIKEANYNKSFEKIGIFVLSQWFSDEYEAKLIEKLNDLILNIAMYKLDSLDEATKLIIKENILETIKVFKEIYTEAYRNKKIVTITSDDEEIDENEIITEKTNNTEIQEEQNSQTEEKTNTWVIKNVDNNQTEDNKNDTQTVNEDWIYEIYNPYLFVVNYDNVPVLWDVYWNSVIWYLQEWDIIEQTTQLHSSGFFKVKIRKSDSFETWTEGYVFIKYLKSYYIK